VRGGGVEDVQPGGVGHGADLRSADAQGTGGVGVV
jgi:hypothetical protein